MTLFLLMLFSHWVCDFVVQTDWQARNKSSSWGALAIHVFTYSVGMTLFLVVGIGHLEIVPYNYSSVLIWFFALTFTSHFLTDAVTSRINTYLWSKDRVHDFFVSVGFDQFIHQMSIFLTLRYLGLI